MTPKKFKIKSASTYCAARGVEQEEGELKCTVYATCDQGYAAVGAPSLRQPPLSLPPVLRPLHTHTHTHTPGPAPLLSLPGCNCYTGSGEDYQLGVTATRFYTNDKVTGLPTKCRCAVSRAHHCLLAWGVRAACTAAWPAPALPLLPHAGSSLPALLSPFHRRR